MTIPDYQTVKRPVLAYLAHGESRATRQVITAMADEFGLNDDELAELLQSGKQRVIDNRVSWALTYLSQAGLLERPARAQVCITDVGKTVLASHPTRVDTGTLGEFPSYREFKRRVSQRRAPSSTVDDVPDSSEQVSPQDLVE